MKQQITECLKTMSRRASPSSTTSSSLTNTAPGWVPDQEADPGTEIKSGDLYLLSGPVDTQSDTANNNRNSKNTDKSGSFCRNNTSSSSNSSCSNNNNKKRAPSKHPVHVKVYRSCFGHYAVVTASLRTPATYINLRTCTCRPCFSSTDSKASSNTLSTPSYTSSSSARSFRVELGGGEGHVIYFEVSSRDKEGIDSWLKAFQSTSAPPCPGTISPSLSPVIPRSPIMPTLQESIEEEDEEEEEEEKVSLSTVQGLAVG